MPVQKGSFARRSVVLLILIIVGVTLLERSLTKKRTILRKASSNSHLRVARDFPTSGINIATGLNDAPESYEVQINGYWKELRASLGLPPLPATVAFPYGSEIGPGDLMETTGSVLTPDEQHSRRLGRLNPTLRRRWPAFNRDSLRSENDTRKKSEKVARDRRREGLDLAVERTRDYEFAKSRLANRGPEIEPDAYLDLFIAPDAYGTPRTPVGALAASFRAIAARELKTRRGAAHVRRANRTLR